MTDDDDVKIANNELAKVRRGKVAGCVRKIASENSPFLVLRQVLEIVPLGRTSLYNLIADNEFPRPKRMGPRAVAWNKAEVMAWVNDKLKA